MEKRYFKKMNDLSGDLFEIEELADKDKNLLDAYASRVVREYYIISEEYTLSANRDMFLKHDKKEYEELCRRLIKKGVNLIACFYRMKIYSGSISSLESFVQNLMRLNREENVRSVITVEDLEEFISSNKMYEHIDENGRFLFVKNLKEIDEFVVWTAFNLKIEFVESAEGYNAYLMILCLIDDAQFFALHTKGVFPKFAYKYFVKDLLRMEKIDRVPLPLIFMWEEKDEQI